MSNNFSETDFSILEYSLNNMRMELSKMLDNVFVEGLKLKGFEFEKKSELESFIKSNCKYEHHVDVKQKIYYVNNIPFLLHNYEPEYDFDINKIDKKRLTANCGYYCFL
jgi:hypothetical protein